MWLNLPTAVFTDREKKPKQMRIYWVLDFEMTQSTLSVSRKIMLSWTNILFSLHSQSGVRLLFLYMDIYFIGIKEKGAHFIKFVKLPGYC